MYFGRKESSGNNIVDAICINVIGEVAVALDIAIDILEVT